MDNIRDKTLRALGFYISATGYLEEESSRFTDVTDLELTTKPTVVDNPGQVVTDSEEKVVKKKNKRVAKIKERLAKLCAPVGSPLSPRPESSLFLSPRSVPAPVPALVFAPLPTPVPAPLSRPGSPVVLSSGRVPAPAAVSRQALMSPLPMLGPPLPLGPSSLRTFKQSLSDEPWPCVSTSPAKLFRPFPALDALNPDNNNGSYNPTDKSERKRGFNTTFINSRPLTGNHD